MTCNQMNAFVCDVRTLSSRRELMTFWKNSISRLPGFSAHKLLQFHFTHVQSGEQMSDTLSTLSPRRASFHLIRVGGGNQPSGSHSNSAPLSRHCHGTINNTLNFETQRFIESLELIYLYFPPFFYLTVVVSVL